MVLAKNATRAPGPIIVRSVAECDGIPLETDRRPLGRLDRTRCNEAP
jgi:hypothetical protein